MEMRCESVVARLLAREGGLGDGVGSADESPCGFSVPQIRSQKSLHFLRGSYSSMSATEKSLTVGPLNLFWTMSSIPSHTLNFAAIGSEHLSLWASSCMIEGSEGSSA